MSPNMDRMDPFKNSGGMAASVDSGLTADLGAVRFRSTTLLHLHCIFRDITKIVQHET